MARRGEGGLDLPAYGGRKRREEEFDVPRDCLGLGLDDGMIGDRLRDRGGRPPLGGIPVGVAGAGGTRCERTDLEVGMGGEQLD